MGVSALTSPPEIWSLAWWDEIVPLVQAVVVLITGYVAVRGLNAWREQVVGKRKAELAELVLVSFYAARDAFQWVRTGVFMEGEGEARQPGGGEAEQVRKMRNTYSIPLERLAHERELFAKLRAQRYAFRAYFGEKASQPFEALFKAYATIQATASTLIQVSHFDQMQPSVAEARDAMLNTLGWGRRERPDDMDKSIDAAVSEIEALCKPILEGKRT
jgi:hypothetical protein